MKRKRILIFNVNWLGDVLFSTATIRNLRRAFADSYLACAIPSRCYPVLKGNPHLDEIIIFDEKDRHKSIQAKIRFIKLLKGKKFDTVFLLHRSFTRAFICWLAGIPERIGYCTKKRGFLLTKKIPPIGKATMHRIDYYLNIIEQCGLKPEDRFLDFCFSGEDESFVGDFLRRSGISSEDFLVGINPGGNWLLKRWPKENWARLADKLIVECRAKVIIAGSPADCMLAADITKMMKGRPVVACGAFNLKQSAALFNKLDVFVTADTGPLHIANAVGTKNIIALFGPTSPAVTGPCPVRNVVILHEDVGCKVPCYDLGCKNNRCMQAITPEEVIDKIKLLKVTNDK